MGPSFPAVPMFKGVNYFLFLCLFLAVMGLCCCMGSSLQGLVFCCSVQPSHCGGFSRCGAQALGAWASVVAVCRLWSSGLVVVGLVALGPVGSSQTRIEPESPALQGGLSTTRPPGKPKEVS